MATLWEKLVPLEAFQAHNPLPEMPGVYFFLDQDRKLLYIGKATSLCDRVRSYFLQDLVLTRGPKVALMLGEIRYIGYRQTDSVLEALILESKFIKAEQPRYNSDAKDDKSYNHVVITQEKYPRVLIVRGRDIEQGKFTEPVKHLFGPFPDGGALREAMRIVRRIFPYRDKCEPFIHNQQPTTNNQQRPNTKKKKVAMPCFNAQIGLCPEVCTGKVSAKEYARMINHIRLFFEGKKGLLVRSLEQDMKRAATEKRFEWAGEIKKTLFALQHIQDMALIKDDLSEHTKHRIEAYDVAHLMGAQSVGVMTVVQNGKSAPSEYRMFKLRRKHNGNDLTALAEVLSRRMKHEEWPLPEMMVIDGGELQYDAAETALGDAALSIPIIGVVKNKRHKAERLIGPEALSRRFKKEILLANSEAHRFAITFHRKRRGKEFLLT